LVANFFVGMLKPSDILSQNIEDKSSVR